MTKFWKRNKPSGDYKIEFWLSCLEAVSYLAVLTRLYIIYSVQSKYGQLGNGTVSYSRTVAIILIGEHIVITFNYIVQLIIKDIPEWVNMQRALVKLETKAIST